MVTGDLELIQTILHGEEGNPTDLDLDFDIKATGEALKADGKFPNFPFAGRKGCLRKP